MTTKTKQAWLVVQQGGSSHEMYLHGFVNKREAETYRRSAARSSYMTSEPIPVPLDLEAHPEFHRTFEAAIDAAMRLARGY